MTIQTQPRPIGEAGSSRGTQAFRTALFDVATEYLAVNGRWVTDQMVDSDHSGHKDHLRETIAGELLTIAADTDAANVPLKDALTRMYSIAFTRQVASPEELAVTAIRAGAKPEDNGPTPAERVADFTSTIY